MGRQMDFLMKISKACWVPVPDDQVDRRDSPYWSERDRQRLNLVESVHNGWAKMRDRLIRRATIDSGLFLRGRKIGAMDASVLESGYLEYTPRWVGTNPIPT